MFKSNYINLPYLCLFLVSVQFLDKFHYWIFALFCVLLLQRKLDVSFFTNRTFFFVLLWGLSYQIFAEETFYSVALMPLIVCFSLAGYSMVDSRDDFFELLAVMALGTALLGILTSFFSDGVIIATTEEERAINSFWTGVMMSRNAYVVSFFLLSAILIDICNNEEIGIVPKVVSVVACCFTLYASIILATRSPVVFPLLIVAVSYFAYISETMSLKKVIVPLSALLLLVVLYSFDVLGIRSLFETSYLFERFTDKADGGIIGNSRFGIQSTFADVWMKSLWGGLYGKIHYYFHNTWLDMYSFGGIIPAIFFLLFSVRYLVNSFIIFRESDAAQKSYIAGVFLAFFLPLCSEPLFWGAPCYFSLFVFCCGALEKMVELEDPSESESELESELESES